MGFDVASGLAVDVGEEDECPCEPVRVGCSVVDEGVEPGLSLLVLLCVVEILCQFHGSLCSVDGDVVVGQFLVVLECRVDVAVGHVVLCTDKSCLRHLVGRDFACSVEDF